MCLKNARLYLEHIRSCLPPCPLQQATRFIPAPNSTHHISGPKSFPQEEVSRAVTCRRPFWALPCGHMVTYFCKVYKTRVKPPLVKTPASLHWDAASLPLFLMLALEWAGQSCVGKPFSLGLVGHTCVFGIQLFPYIEKLLVGVMTQQRLSEILSLPTLLFTC